MKDTGKLSRTDFEGMLAGKLGAARKEVSTGPAFGVDVAVVDLPGSMAMALTSDPLSLIPSLGLKESAWLSVQLMANDMATTGVAPMYVQFVLNLPAWLGEKDFNIYWEYIHGFCSDIGVAVTGGHTGSMEGLDSTVAGGGTMITIAPKDRILVSSGARRGDSILVTKECAVSSTAILALSFGQVIASRLGPEIVSAGRELFWKSSSLQDALLAAMCNEHERVVSAFHDVTEGGVLGAVYELAVASGNGAIINGDDVPVGRAQREICGLFSIDPRYSLGSGSMVMTVQKGQEEKVISTLADNDIACTVIGALTGPEQGLKIRDEQGKVTDLEYPDRDPYWNAFFTAVKKGWK